MYFSLRFIRTALHIALFAILSLALSQTAWAQSLPEIRCPLLNSPASGSGAPQNPTPIDNTQPGEQIRTLAVRITTNSGFMSGTNNDVWLDIGPKAWKIGDNFETGSTKTIYIDLTTAHGNLDSPSVVPLYVDDISEVRLEKKGICGLTNAPDSLFDPTFGLLPGFDPSNSLSSLQAQVRVAKQLLDQSQEAIDAQQHVIEAQLKLINDAQLVISRTAEISSSGPRQLADLQNQLVEVQNQLAQMPTQVIKQVCHTDRVVQGAVGIALGGAAGAVLTKIVCNNVSVVNDAWTQLTNNVSTLQKAKNDLQADVTSAPVKRAAALESMAVAQSTQAAAQFTKMWAEGIYQAARQALNEARDALTTAQDISSRLPHFDWTKFLPHPGAWSVDGFTLIVNGRDFASFSVPELIVPQLETTSVILSNSDVLA